VVVQVRRVEQVPTKESHQYHYNDIDTKFERQVILYHVTKALYFTAQSQSQFRL